MCRRLKVKFDKTSCFVYFSSLPCTYESRISSRKLQNLIQSKLKGHEFVCHAIYDHLEGLRVLFIHWFIFSVTAAVWTLRLVFCVSVLFLWVFVLFHWLGGIWLIRLCLLWSDHFMITHTHTQSNSCRKPHSSSSSSSCRLPFFLFMHWKKCLRVTAEMTSAASWQFRKPSGHTYTTPPHTHTLRTHTHIQTLSGNSPFIFLFQ